MRLHPDAILMPKPLKTQEVEVTEKEITELDTELEFTLLGVKKAALRWGSKGERGPKRFWKGNGPWNSIYRSCVNMAAVAHDHEPVF